jgi:hypothetical protein
MFFMKPWFIHKYKPLITEQQDEFIDLFLKEAKKLEKTYVEEAEDKNAFSGVSRAGSVQSVFIKFDQIRSKSIRHV